MKERIFKMLLSSDKDMAVLGMTVALTELGSEWCLANLPFDERSNNKMRHNVDHGYFGVEKQRVMIFYGVFYIHCRYIEDFITTSKDVINL